MTKQHHFDVLIIGSGAAGLMSALQLSKKFSIALISKDQFLEGSSFYAQGGISAVLDSNDNFHSHITDTLNTGCGIGDIKSIRFMVENAPNAVAELESLGVEFSQKDLH